jgi:hypothetical protein
MLNKNLIAHELCVKKFEKNNHCQGKCHLKKEIEKDNERQSKNKQLSKNAEEVLFANEFENINPVNFVSMHLVSNSQLYQLFPVGYLDAVFHPPSPTIILA